METFAPKSGQINYFTQRNNWLHPGGACFPTSVAMALANNGIESVSPILRNFCIDDLFFTLANANSVGGEFAESYGIASNNQQWWPVMQDLVRWFCNGGSHHNLAAWENYIAWNEAATSEQIAQSISAGYSVVLGTQLTSYGHVVVAYGFNASGVYLADPYGDPHTDYKSHDGRKVFVKRGTKAWANLFVNGEDRARALFIHADGQTPIL